MTAPNVNRPKRYKMSLSAREYKTLLQLLNEYLAEWQQPDDSPGTIRVLRAIRARLLRETK